MQYYGEVRQSTGEDWTNVQLALSTAQPAIGGEATKPSPWRLTLAPPPQPVHFKAMRHRMMRAAPGSMREESASDMDEVDAAIPPPMGAAPMLAMAPAPMAMSMATAVAEPSTGLSATVFEIPHKSSVPADGSSHKVTVAIIDLKPVLEYYTAPKVAAHAYLKAKVRTARAAACHWGRLIEMRDGLYNVRSFRSRTRPTTRCWRARPTSSWTTTLWRRPRLRVCEFGGGDARQCGH